MHMQWNLECNLNVKNAKKTATINNCANNNKKVKKKDICKANF